MSLMRPGPIIRLVLLGPWAAIGHEIEKLGDIGFGDVCHQPSAAGAFNHLLPHVNLIRCDVWGQL